VWAERVSLTVGGKVKLIVGERVKLIVGGRMLLTVVEKGNQLVVVR
jgi:hypothetical protein